MNKKPIYLGAVKASFDLDDVRGEQVDIEGETYYKISNVQAMRPFFMSIVSDSNHWMFIASNGGLTAGRKDCDQALFPYYTDDKITESADLTGSKTLFLVDQADKRFLWEPFSTQHQGLYKIRRNLYKNFHGNKIVFEECNHDLGLTFRYQWNSSNRFGFVKKASLHNHGDKKVGIRLMDGLQNLLPYGLSADLQNSKSNLADAYKKNELADTVGLGIYALSAIIVDKAVPSEALKANIAWSLGLEKPTYLLSSLQLGLFRRGLPVQQETAVKAEKGAYFVVSDLQLETGEKKQWMLAANVNQTISALKTLSDQLTDPETLALQVQADIDLGTRKLTELAAASDGLQRTADKLQNTRHYANTLFNVMRGGIFDDHYQIDRDDFERYLLNAYKSAADSWGTFLASLPERFTLTSLKAATASLKDTDLQRLCIEYLPLKFSRRHGDPSRPWNKFLINTTRETDGAKILDYEGNWRDIFQNWEALAQAYPAFIDGMIHKFLNASTFEGYNPYRVTKGGFDWEVVEPNDPWSFIGYWGDHQLIYLLKFLEFSERHDPGKLATYFDQELFVYANVPYKIKSYEATLKDPKDTIVFDWELDQDIRKRRETLGADGALLTDAKGAVYHVNLLEKLLVTLLAKVSNFIPEAGIWLNTQRPEWNDANNALVGNGVSMVTLYYLRRFLTFFEKILQQSSLSEVSISAELYAFFEQVNTTLQQYEYLLAGKIGDKDRKQLLDALGRAGSRYRTTVYKAGFSGIRNSLSKKELLGFVQTTVAHLEHSIDANKRPDGLYHAYNLMTLSNDREIAVSYLAEMLEGQVAVLSAGYLSSTASLALLDSLKQSALFRDDQYSYLLYPNKDLLRFVDKNLIPAADVDRSQLLTQLLLDGNAQIIEKDLNGDCHFNGNFNNADSLKEALASLPRERYASLLDKETPLLLEIFETVFDHKSFTGRSGTFFGYEGLGSIYWHMVSKLLLAVQETCLIAIESEESAETIGRLLAHYYEINEGIGVHKSPELYGAFPTDPYSHTPAGKGAQQPGMTGQVKEDILSRMGELGLVVINGTLRFQPNLLRKAEFLKAAESFTHIDIHGQEQPLALQAGSLCFSYCQVPVVYQLADRQQLELVLEDGSLVTQQALQVDREMSQELFKRSGKIRQINVFFDKLDNPLK